ncbi:putative 4-coumarate--CoA ligase 1 [Dermacentor variabilis]|uniref:putative 4-coumarate--CoA ligase 1 n=1 Tax=Dermacentor variabilis TaxID=34621 RepID=UPI003F5BFC87
MKARIENGIVYSPFPTVDIPLWSAYTLIKEALSKSPERVALVEGSVRTTRGDLLALMESYAAGFQLHGVGPGDRVCTHLKNSVENLAAMYGCIFTGATLVLAKTSLTENELRGQIIDSDSTHVLTDVELTEKVKNATSNLKLKLLFAMDTASGFVSTASFKELDKSAFRGCPVEDPREAIIVVVYTSGTTGLPKGVEHTHYSFVANYFISKPCSSSDEKDTVLASAPIAHLSGLLLGLMAVLDGSMCVLTQPGVKLQEMVKLIKEHNITSMFTFPTRLHALTEKILRTGERIKSIRRIGVGGGALPQTTYDATFKSFVNLTCIVNLYAMTESGGMVCSPSVREAKGIDMGFPAVMVEAKVVDPVTRMKLGPNETGEICFRIPTVMRGYYKRPKETAEFFEENGWCRSGDVGYYDEDGRFHFVQRMKELIKCMDNQVVPAELEQLLLQEHSADIAEVAVVGIPQAQYGEAPAAVVVLKENPATCCTSELTEKMKRTIAEKLAVHKQLYGGVFFLDVLPKTDMGKINRAALVEQWAAIKSAVPSCSRQSAAESAQPRRNMKARIENGVVYSPFPTVDIPWCSAYTVIKAALSKAPERVAFMRRDGKEIQTKHLILTFCSRVLREFIEAGGELLALMESYAAGFQQHNVGPGDRVCTQLKNNVENFAAMYGCIFTKATLVLAKSSLTENPREAIIVFLHTSRTTGLPKGVEHTHYSFVANYFISKYAGLLS